MRKEAYVLSFSLSQDIFEAVKTVEDGGHMPFDGTEFDNAV